MDWTIVVSVLAALLLFPLVIALVGGTIFLAAATLFRGRLKGMKGHAAKCMEVCGSGGTANPPQSEPCR
jgi:hypothetical protein